MKRYRTLFVLAMTLAGSQFGLAAAIEISMVSYATPFSASVSMGLPEFAFGSQ